jgi:hypothetical protein
LAYLEFNRKDYAKLIEEKELKIKDLHNTISEIYADTSLVPKVPERLTQNDPRCPKQCGRFRNEHGIEGNRTCRNHCDNNWYLSYDRQRELQQQAVKRHITPLVNQQENIRKEIAAIKEKQNIPILRQQLRTATDEYRTLSPNDPEFRQKQIDQKKSLYEKAVALDTLERKHNLFGNLPPVRPEREIIEVTPDPITVYKEPEIIEKSITIGTAELDYKKLAIAGAGIFAVLALIIWRLK